VLQSVWTTFVCKTTLYRRTMDTTLRPQTGHQQSLMHYENTCTGFGCSATSYYISRGKPRMNYEVQERRTLAMHGAYMGAPFKRTRPPKGISTRTLTLCNAAYSNRDVSAHGNNAQRTRAHENNVRTTHGEHARRTENSGQRTGPRTADSEQANSRIVRQGDTTGTTSGCYKQEEHVWYYNNIGRTL
jgi:hypothetical protein